MDSIGTRSELGVGQHLTENLKTTRKHQASRERLSSILSCSHATTNGSLQNHEAFYLELAVKELLFYSVFLSNLKEIKNRMDKTAAIIIR